MKLLLQQANSLYTHRWLY